MKKITILLFAVAVIASGCKKFTNINNNPNQPTVVTPNVVLSSALVGSGNLVAGGYINTARWMGYLSRSGNYIETVPTETYVIDPSYEDGDFQAAYEVMQSYNYIEHNSGGDPFYVGVAKVMKAMHFGTLVDGFGDIPYTQAFNLTKYPNPTYDKAATVYASIITQCDSAVIYFQKAITYYGTAPGVVLTNDNNADIMFGRGGSASATTRMNEWIRFTNTVKLRLLMTVRQAGGTFTTSYIQNELNTSAGNGQGYIVQSNATTAGNDETASVNPGYTSATQAQLSPFYGIWETNTGSASQNAAFFRASQYFINTNPYDNTFSDIYSQVTGLSFPWAGNYDGDPNSVSNSGTSTVNVNATYGLCKAPTQNQWIMTDVESLFWQAEAVQAGFTGVSSFSAAKLAKEGVEQKYVMVNDAGGTPSDNIADADGVLASDDADSRFSVGTAFGWRSLMTLKWTEMCMINWEQAYTDYRRLGYPIPEKGSSPIFGFSHANNVAQHSMADVENPAVNWPVSLPFRYLYPSSEIATNGKNVPSGVTAYTPIFWDVREK